VNLATSTPATHRLVVRHHDRPGVLACVFDRLRAAGKNVQETENIVFEGAEAAVARINIDGPLSAEELSSLSQSNADILEATLIAL
jgi:D-3-phosphoglycerate dehydrogenase